MSRRLQEEEIGLKTEFEWGQGEIWMRGEGWGLEFELDG